MNLVPHYLNVPTIVDSPAFNLRDIDLELAVCDVGEFLAVLGEMSGVPSGSVVLGNFNAGDNTSTLIISSASDNNIALLFNSKHF
jgi:hypothetical protein